MSYSRKRITKINQKIFLIFSMIVMLSNTSIYVDGYYQPNIYFDYTLNFYQNASILQFQVDANSLQILTTSEQIIAYDSKTTYPSIISTLSNISNQKISNMYLQPWGYQYCTFVMDQFGTLYYYDMGNQYIYVTLSTNATSNTSISTTGLSIFVLNSFENNSATAILSRYDHYNTYTLKQVISTNVAGIVQMKSSQSSSIQQTVVLWNTTGYIQVLNCTSSCIIMYQLEQNSIDKAISDILLLGGFNLIVDYCNIKTLAVYNLIYGLEFNSINYNQTILSLQFVDAYLKNFAAFYSNNSLVIYQAWGNVPFTYIYQYDNFNSLTTFSKIDGYTNKIYVASQDKIEAYVMVCPWKSYMKINGLCAPCDVNCQDCDPVSGVCSICKSSYQLVNSTCIYQNITLNNTVNSTLNTTLNCTDNNATNSSINATSLNSTLNQTINNATNTNSSLNSTSLNNTNATANSTQNSTSNSSIILSNNSQSSSLNNQQSFEEKIMQNVVLNTINTISFIVSKAFLILQIAPLAWLFLQFINYWNICSFYVLINIPIPDYLTGFLSQIYNAVNESVFQQFGMNIQLCLDSPELVSNPNLLKYQITSNFISDNFQGIVIIFFICFILIVIKIIKNFLPKTHWISKFLKIDNFLIIVGQYIPLMGSIFLPISFIYDHLNYLEISSKINLLLNVYFVGISILIPFLLLSYFQIVKKHRLNIKTVKKIVLETQKKQLNLEQYNWFFYSIINITISFVISFQNPKVFLICNFFCFIFGIFLSYKSSVRRVNNIILSLHIFFFHIGFIGMFVSYSYSEDIYHYFSTFTLFFFFTGAIHEILTLIIQSILEIYKWIRKRTIKISPKIQNKSQITYETNKAKFKQTQVQEIQEFEQTIKQNQKPRYKITLKKTLPPKSKYQGRKQKKTFTQFKHNQQLQQNIPSLRTKKFVTFSKKYKLTKVVKLTNIPIKNDLIIRYTNIDMI